MAALVKQIRKYNTTISKLFEIILSLNEEQQEMLADLRQKENERQEEVTRIRSANCDKARDVLERLTQHGRIKVRDEAGETRILPEDERQQRIEEAQAGIAANCEATS